MSIKEQLFTSFIGGIGKTAGSITVFGLISCTWYLYNRMICTEKVPSENIEVIDESTDTMETMEAIETMELMEAMEEIEKSSAPKDDPMSLENVKRILGSHKGIDIKTKTSSEPNYRKIFDKM